MKIRNWIEDHIIHSNAEGRVGKYIVQCLIATAFIVFTKPHSHASRARSLLGGYAVGTIVGLLFAVLRELLMLIFAQQHDLVIAGVTGALAVGLCMLIMVFTNSEHPPAAGLALGIVVNDWDLGTLAVVLLGVSILYGAKTLLRNYLIDLR